jgi:hypothetical protein
MTRFWTGFKLERLGSENQELREEFEEAKLDSKYLESLSESCQALKHSWGSVISSMCSDCNDSNIESVLAIADPLCKESLALLDEIKVYVMSNSQIQARVCANILGAHLETKIASEHLSKSVELRNIDHEQGQVQQNSPSAVE